MAHRHLLRNLFIHMQQTAILCSGVPSPAFLSIQTCHIKALSKMVQLWCNSCAFLSCKTIGMSNFFETFRDITAADRRVMLQILHGPREWQTAGSQAMGSQGTFFVQLRNPKNHVYRLCEVLFAHQIFKGKFLLPFHCTAQDAPEASSICWMEFRYAVPITRYSPIKDMSEIL